MGQVLALTLLRQHGITMTLYDDGKPSVALSAAGMIAPLTELDRAHWLIAELGIRSLKLWPALLELLHETVYFQQRGALVCAHPQDRAEWQHYRRRIEQQPQNVEFQELKTAAIRQLEPELQGMNEAYYFPQEGQLDCQQLLTVMRHFLTQQITIAPASDLTADYDYIIDCRGLGAKTTFSDLYAVRGEVVWLQADAVRLTRPIRLLHPRYSIYIVPRPQHIYLVGASEIESEDTSQISLRSMMELLSAAYSVHKGFMEARIIHTTAACRPTLSHHLPKIKYQGDKIAINGLYRHGFSLAPVLADEVASYLMQGSRAYPNLWEEAYVDLS